MYIVYVLKLLVYNSNNKINNIKITLCKFYIIQVYLILKIKCKIE